MGTGNRTAVNVLRAWLSAAGADVEDGQGGADIVVLGVRVAVVPEGEPNPPDVDVCVSAKDVMSREPRALVESFRRVASAAGISAADPGRAVGDVDERGERRKISYLEDDFMVALRHAEFCRSPNPAPEALKKYEPICARSARSFRRSNEGWCRLAGFEHGDLMTYALCWATIWLGMYERRHSEDDDRK